MKIKENAGAYAAPELKETVVSVENGFATSTGDAAIEDLTEQDYGTY